jgi:uncharacterized membrane protein YkvA (DUF1232 family)
MNVIAFLIARYVKAGRFGRAAALFPLLGKMGLRGFAAGSRDVFRYIVSGKATKKELAILIVAIVYFLSPIDLIPDYIPFVGIADDVVIAALVAGYLHRKAMESMSENGAAAGTVK